MKTGLSDAPARWLVIALVFAAGVWLFAQRVLIPYQMGDATVHERPRGNLSDLYPRWLGARELLLHGRDPYSPEVTKQIQAGYYGRVLDPSRPGDPKDRQGFAYPLYVVFWLLPIVHLPFSIVQKVFLALLLVLTIANALLWLRLLGMRSTRTGEFVIAIFTIGSLAVMQGLKLQQISLLVAGLLAIAIWLLVADHQIAAGIVLALASVKPQLVILLLLWLAIWTFGDLRRRCRWAAAFAVVMAVQIAAAEYYLPHWIPRFWQAVREYREYTGAISVSEVLVGTALGRAIEVLAFAILLRLCWRARVQAASSPAFAATTSVVIALVVLLIPTDSVYNQVLLIPAVLLLVRDWRSFWTQDSLTRIVFGVAAILVIWPWISSVALALLSLLISPQTVQRAWAVPFWTVVPTPLGVAALMLVRADRWIFADSVVAATS